MSHKQTSKRTRPSPEQFFVYPIWTRQKSAVLNSLNSTDAQRGYRHAIDEFVDWSCSEPGLSFNRTVVLRHSIHLESRRLARGTVNLRLGAVRRLACEAADRGLLSPDLAAGVRRVKALTDRSPKACLFSRSLIPPEKAIRLPLRSLWQIRNSDQQLPDNVFIFSRCRKIHRLVQIVRRRMIAMR